MQLCRLVRSLEIVSILQFGVLGNYLFGLRIDFRADLEWLTVLRLASLSLATVAFYLMMDLTRRILEEAQAELDAEQVLARKVANPLESRFRSGLHGERTRLVILLSVSTFGSAAFFFLEPAVEYVFGA